MTTYRADAGSSIYRQRCGSMCKSGTLGKQSSWYTYVVNHIVTLTSFHYRMVCFIPANVELIMCPVCRNYFAAFQRAVSFGVNCIKAKGRVRYAGQCQKAGAWSWKVGGTAWPGNLGSLLTLWWRVPNVSFGTDSRHCIELWDAKKARARKCEREGCI